MHVVIHSCLQFLPRINDIVQCHKLYISLDLALGSTLSIIRRLDIILEILGGDLRFRLELFLKHTRSGCCLYNQFVVVLTLRHLVKQGSDPLLVSVLHLGRLKQCALYLLDHRLGIISIRIQWL